MQLTYTNGSNLPSILDWVVELETQYKVVDVIDVDVYAPNSFDLYNRIKLNYLPEFSAEQRIVLTFSNEYTKDNHPSMMLSSIQTMLNEIDISNYFVCIVSSNPNIEQDYDWVLKNISSDPIPVHIYKASGDYELLESTYKPYRRFENIPITNLTQRQQQLLDSNNFCILPWTSLYVLSNNEVRPCCWWRGKLGDTKKQNLKEIWNGEQLRKLRQNMLADIPTSECKTCYTKEQVYKDDTVYRSSFNRKFIDEIPLIDSTKDDGSLDSFNIKLLNYKHNNLCNLQCRMCSSKYSSSLHQVEVALGEATTDKALAFAGKHKLDIFEQFSEHVGSLRQVIFEGGEPLMIKETYDFVELLDKHKRHDIQLMYITNMTHTGLGKRKVLDLWRNFTDVIVYGSLDADHMRGNYLRPGTDWEKIVNFRKQMVAHRPDIFFSVHSTLTLLNALHMPDFHKSWVEQGLVEPQHWIVNTLIHPQYMRVATAPEYLKDQIREKFHKHLEWLRPLDPFGKSSAGYVAILHTLDNNDAFDPGLFWNKIEARDQYHNVKLLDVFPELVDLPR